MYANERTLGRFHCKLGALSLLEYKALELAGKSGSSYSTLDFSSFSFRALKSPIARSSGYLPVVFVASVRESIDSGPFCLPKSTRQVKRNFT